MEIKNINTILAVCIVIGLVTSFLLVIQKPLYVDEIAHYYVISSFCSFDYSKVPDFLPQIPGYHFFAGLFGWLSNCSEAGIRLFTLLLSFASIFVAFKLSEAIGIGIVDKRLKVLVYILLPILFPYFFLIYTDVISLLFILLMFYFLVKENYPASALFGALGFVVRQNNILWVLFSIVYVLIGKSGKIGPNKLKEVFSPGFIKKVLPYIIVLLIAAAFFIKNGGFAIGGKGEHPALSFSMMNIYTALFYFFWLNAPDNIANLKTIRKKVMGFDRKRLLVVLFAIALFFSFFLFTFKITHIWNQYPEYGYFFRNALLGFFDSSFILRSVLFLCILYSVMSLWTLKTSDRRMYLFYIFSAIFLGSSWLIESRYFLIPFVMTNLLAVREKMVEKRLIIWYLIVTVVYMYFWLSGQTFW